MDDLVNGEAALTEYAGKSMRAAEVYLELKNRKPHGIYSFIGDIWHFDADGTRQQDLKEGVKDALELLDATHKLPDNYSSVIDIKSQLTEKKYKDKYQWEVTQDEFSCSLASARTNFI